MTGRGSRKIRGLKPVQLKGLSQEQPVDTAVEMSSVGEIVLDSIRDKHPGISEAQLLKLAGQRIYQERSSR